MISIILPVYNEEACLQQFYQCLTAVLEPLQIAYELIFINDGSADGSLGILLSICRENPRARVVDFSRNFGHQAAIVAGLKVARGDAVIMMDTDLQHPPELIPTLLEKWREGYEIVYTVRASTPDSGFFKNITSTLFYKAINRLSDVNIPIGAADFRLMDRAVVDVFRELDERALFLRGLVSWVGYRQIGVTYEAHPRYGGSSKYSLKKMVQFAVRGITSFSSLPLYGSVIIGLGLSLLSFLYGLYALYIKLFTDRGVEGWTSILFVLVFLGGMNMMTMGLHGIYIGRIFEEVKKRPVYLVRKTYGFPTAGEDQPATTDGADC